MTSPKVMGPMNRARRHSACVKMNGMLLTQSIRSSLEIGEVGWRKGRKC
jgi:hypothetical protein